MQRFKSTDSIQSATGFEKPYSKQEEYGGLEKRDSNDVAVEEGGSKVSTARRGSMSKQSSRNELDRRYDSPTQKVNVDVISKTYEVGGVQRAEDPGNYMQQQQHQQQQPQQQGQQQYYGNTQEDQNYGNQGYGYEKSEDEYNREKFEDRRFSPEKPPLPPSAATRLESPSRHQSETRYSPEQANRVQQQHVGGVPRYEPVQQQFYAPTQPQESVSHQESDQGRYAPQQQENMQQYAQGPYDAQGYEYEQQQQQFNTQGYVQEVQQPSGYQVENQNMQEQYQQEPRYDVAQEQQYR